MGHSVSRQSSGAEANHGFNMVQFTGKFTRTSEENYNEFLKALNVSYILRKAATSSTPVMEISESDGNWVMKTSTSLKAIELKFKMGVPFEENTTDGRKCETTVTMEGNKLITNQKALKEGEKNVVVEREFFYDKLVMKMTVDDVTSTQTYKRNRNSCPQKSFANFP